jgi:hypothetical protein
MYGITLDSAETTLMPDSEIVICSEVLECDTERSYPVEAGESELLDIDDPGGVQPYSNEVCIFLVYLFIW